MTKIKLYNIANPHVDGFLIMHVVKPTSSGSPTCGRPAAAGQDPNGGGSASARSTASPARRSPAVTAPAVQKSELEAVMAAK